MPHLLVEKPQILPLVYISIECLERIFSDMNIPLSEYWWRGKVRQLFTGYGSDCTAAGAAI